MEYIQLEEAEVIVNGFFTPILKTSESLNLMRIILCLSTSMRSSAILHL